MRGKARLVIWLVYFSSTFSGKYFGRKLVISSYDQVTTIYFRAVSILSKSNNWYNYITDLLEGSQVFDHSLSSTSEPALAGLATFSTVNYYDAFSCIDWLHMEPSLGSASPQKGDICVLSNFWRSDGLPWVKLKLLISWVRICMKRKLHKTNFEWTLVFILKY